MEALMCLGENFFRQGKLAKAAVIYEGILAIDPKKNQAILMLGETFLREPNFEKAYAFFIKAFEDMPDSHLLLGAAKSAIALGKIDEAEMLLHRIDPYSSLGSVRAHLLGVCRSTN